MPKHTKQDGDPTGEYFELMKARFEQETEDARRKRYFILMLVRGMLLVILTVYSIGGFGKAWVSGLDDFLHYFTNWSWMLEGVFYLMVLLGSVVPYLFEFSIFVLFLPVFGLAWYVYVVLMLVLWSRPGLLSEIADMDQAVVAVGNEYYHTLPLLLILIFAGLFASDIKRVYGNFLARTGKLGRAAYILYSIFFPTLYSFLYMLFFNPMEVYGVKNLSLLEMITAGIVINTLFSGLAFLFFFPYTPHVMHPRNDMKFWKLRFI